jgi:3-phenylpropionate/trans-cinnamate dioxygenase ferredoxin reductase subunit
MSEAGLVVVGSGPTGVSAAEAFRRHRVDSAVRILTADPAPPYARPPLSKEFLRGETDDVALHPAQWYAENRIELVRTGFWTTIGDATVKYHAWGRRLRP